MSFKTILLCMIILAVGWYMVQSLNSLNRTVSGNHGEQFLTQRYEQLSSMLELLEMLSEKIYMHEYLIAQINISNKGIPRRQWPPEDSLYVEELASSSYSLKLDFNRVVEVYNSEMNRFNNMFTTQDQLPKSKHITLPKQYKFQYNTKEYKCQEQN